MWFKRPYLDLFATRAKAKLPMYVSPVLDPLAWKQDAFQYPWDHLSANSFPPLGSSQAGSLQGSRLNRPLVDFGGSAVAPEEVVCGPSVVVSRRTSRAYTSVEPACPTPCAEVLSRPHVWRLSNVSSERRAFRGRLCESQLQTSGAPL